MTFVWYTPGKCNIPQLIEINKFHKKENRWQSSTFAIKKFFNFHGCRLVFGAKPHINALRINAGPNGSFSYEGYIPRMIKGLEHNLNYTWFFNPTINKTSKFHFNITNNLVVCEECHNRDHVRMRKLAITQSYMFYHKLMTVPPGEEYNCYEKLVMPFDSIVWLLIWITFTISFIAIFIVNSMELSKRNFVFGTNVQTPSLNVAILFFGIAQSNPPRRNFARFLIMMFMLYSMIIRTAWQGKIFEFMQKEVRKPEVQSIDKMIEKNFTIYVYDRFALYFNGSDIVDK